VKQLVELMGGKISVKSDGDDQGTTFSFNLWMNRLTANYSPTPALENDGDRRRLSRAMKSAMGTEPVRLKSSTKPWIVNALISDRALVKVVEKYLIFFLADFGEVNVYTAQAPFCKQLTSIRKGDMGSMGSIVVSIVDDHLLTAKVESQTAQIKSSVSILLSGSLDDEDMEDKLARGWNLFCFRPLRLSNLCSILDRVRGDIDPKSELTGIPEALGAVAGGGRKTEDGFGLGPKADAPLVLVVDDFELMRSLTQKVRKRAKI